MKKLLVFALGMLVSQSLCWAQAAQTCDGTESDGSDQINVWQPVATQPISDAIDFSSCGGELSGGDIVACFTPETTCEIAVFCGSSESVTVNLGYTSSPCSLSPTCLDTISGSGGVQLPHFTVTAGQNYCAYCESDGNAPGELLGFSISNNVPSDCGHLPVSLYRLEID